MNKKIWDLYAPIYERAMRSDHKVYKAMYERIPKMIEEKDVLEIATGPGLLAKHVAHAANKMIATDYSDGMIAEARKGTYPDNLTFQVADATNLPFPDHSFDVVLIANALHVLPEPEKALREIDRVLKDKGLLIADQISKGELVPPYWGLEISEGLLLFRWFPQGPDNILQSVTLLQLIHQHGSPAYGRVDDIDGPSFRIMAGHGQRDPFTVFIGAQDDKLPRLCFSCYQRSFDHKPCHGFIELSLTYDFIHCNLSFLYFSSKLFCCLTSFL